MRWKSFPYFLSVMLCITLAFILRDHYIAGSVLRDGVRGIAPLLLRSAVVGLVAMIAGTALYGDREGADGKRSRLVRWDWAVIGFTMALSATF
jgi:hypothetical protein